MAPEHKYPRTHNTTMITSALPTDILFSNILPRLPAKYVSPLKLVSKEWNSFLSSSTFTKLQFNHATNDHIQNHHKLLFLSPKTTTPCLFHTIDCEALGVMNKLSSSRSLPFEAEDISFLTSCNGLVCVGIGSTNYYYSDMILWNPVTGEYNTLCYPPNSYKGSYLVTGSASVLYYIDSEDTYKLLRVTRNGDAYIYSLLSNSWRKLDFNDELKRRLNVARGWGESIFAWGASIIQNGNIYLIHDLEMRSVNQATRHYYSIIMFNLTTEEFKVIASPCFEDQTTVCLSSMLLLQKDRKLHLCVIYSLCEDKFTKLWRMDGDGDGDWTEVYGVPMSNYSLAPLYLMKNGNWLTVCRSGCHVNEVDPVMDFKKISYVDTTNKIDIAKNGIYIETFVSPNPKMK